MSTPDRIHVRITLGAVSRSALFLLLAVVGCGPSGNDAGERTEVPVARGQVYGAGEGEGALSAVFDVDVGADGRVFVSEPSFARVVVFNADGSFQRTLGRRGRGPGEFQMPGNLMWLGDTLTVLDFQQGITLMSPEGEYYDRISFSVRGESQIFPLAPILPLADGSVGSFAPSPGSEVLAGRTLTETWLRMSRSGEMLDTLARRRLVGEYYALETATRTDDRPHPLGTGELLAAPATGAFLLLANRSIPDPAVESPTYTLMVLGLNGDTIQRAAVPYTQVELSDADIDSIARATTSMDPAAEGYEARVRDIRESVPWPTTYPAFSTVLIGSDGAVWVRRHLYRGDDVQWDVFDAQLQPRGTAHLPKDLDVKLVSADAVYGVELDDLDVPSIVRYDVGG